MDTSSIALALDPGIPGPDLGRYFTAVGLMLVVLLGLAYAIKRLGGHTGRFRGNKRGLSVVEVLPLGGRRQLAVVRCYDRTFAIGLGEKEVSLVAELDPVEVPDSDPNTVPGASGESKEAPADSSDEGTHAQDPFAELIQRAQDRLGSEGALLKPEASSVRELSK